MRVWLAALGLAGCDLVFGTEPIRPDGQMTHDVSPVDGDQLLFPPSSSQPCGSLPPFVSYAWEDDQFFDSTVLSGLAFIDPATHIEATNLNPGPSTVFEVQGGTKRELEKLHAPPGGSVQLPRTSPAGEVLWYRQDAVNAGVYRARSADDFAVKVREDFGLGDAFAVLPGSVGYRDGTARMVIAKQQTIDETFKLVELSSPDGLTWTPLDTIHLSVSTILRDPYLSHDGCTLLFVKDEALNDRLIVAQRGPDGMFTGLPTELSPLAGNTNLTAPALTADQKDIYILATNGGTAMQVVRHGHPVNAVAGK